MRLHVNGIFTQFLLKKSQHHVENFNKIPAPEFGSKGRY
jgi:hypothetical protein